MFKNSTETIQKVADRREEEILANIASLGSKLEELKKEESKYQNKKSEIVILNNEIDLLTKKLTTYQASVLVLQHKLEELDRNHGSSVIDKQTAIKLYEDQIVLLKQELEAIKQSINDLTVASVQDMAIAEKRMADAQIVLEKIEKLIEAETEKLNKIQADISELKQEEKKLSENNRLLTLQNQSLLASVEENKKKNSELEIQISEKIISSKKIDDENFKKTEVVNKEIDSKNKDLDIRQKEIEKREFALSDRDAFLTMRQTELRDMKTSLENYFGKKFNMNI